VHVEKVRADRHLKLVERVLSKTKGVRQSDFQTQASQCVQ
jgi:hypothetical protein